MRFIMTAASGAKSPARKLPILSLPLVPRSSRLTERLLPDPLTPTPASLLSVPSSSPSLLRRSRNVGEGAHFSYVTPLVLEFPYDLKKVEGVQVDDGGAEQTDEQLQEEKKKVEAMNEEERMAYGMQRARKEMDRVEALMRPYEIEQEDNQTSYSSQEHLRAYLPKARRDQSYPSARLLGVSTECVGDCLPQLDLGDSLDWIEKHAGKDGPDCYSSGPIAEVASPIKVGEGGQGDAVQARTQLSDFLSGRLIGALMPSKADLEGVAVDAEPGVGQAQQSRVAQRDGDNDQESKQQRWQRRANLLSDRQSDKAAYIGYAPWANAYSGHQFGQWAGQLGDGRATTLMETVNGQTGQRWEIQLKGAGRTPYSRFADGLAALFSSVREYLASEAMHGLGIPTSRALALLSVKDVTVVREHHHPAAVCARLAPIWTRVGSFEHHATRQEWESVRLLGEFVCREGYGWTDVDDEKPWAERLIRECARRNAETVALWQAYGFMHGVMNTDNISLLGITIDYGPYGFMDIFDRSTICNKSDGEGRYAFNMQPTAAMFVMQKLTSSLAAFVGFERKHGRAPKPGEMVAETNEEEINELGRATQDELWSSVKEYFMDTLIGAWTQAWRKRLLLTSSNESDRTDLIDPLLDILDGYLDFTQSLRKLHTLPTFVDGKKDDVQGFVDQWLDWERVPSFVRDQRRADALTWCKRYVDRLRRDHTSFDSFAVESKAVNPAFTLRNWITDEVNERLRLKDDTDFLAKILHMSLHPFEPWGEQVDGKDGEDVQEEKRLCSVGTLLTTNMPSCSS